MTTSIDTNILVSLWDVDSALNAAARRALDRALSVGSLVAPAPVFTELLAFPDRPEAFLDSFFRETGIVVEWDLGEAVWRAAGRAFRDYSFRRRSRREPMPRRILADFLIGAHSYLSGYPLLTLDSQFYRTAYPALELAPI